MVCGSKEEVISAPEQTGRPVASILRGLRKQPGTCLLLRSIMLSFSPPHPSVTHALASYFLFLPLQPSPEPPPNSQHAPVLRNPPRPTATPPRRGAEHIPSREGCRVSGGVGCPQQGTHPGLRPPLQGGEQNITPPWRGAAHIPPVSSPLRKRPGSVITRV